MLKIIIRARRDWRGSPTVRFMAIDGKPSAAFLGKDVGSVSLVESERDGAGEALSRASVSLGPAEQVNGDAIRRAAGALARWLTKHETPQAGIDMESIDGLLVEGAREALCVGLLTGAFRFERYQSRRKGMPPVEVSLLVDREDKELAGTVQEATAIAEAVNLTRAWAHEPPNVLNPATLADWTLQMASESGLQCKVLDDEHLRQIGAGAILAVGGGSSVQPRLIILEWPGKAKRSAGGPIILVGKAITFDTGGYTIKTRAGLIGSKFDKCGGVTVVGVLKAVAALGFRRRVVGIIAAAENAISQGAYRPNDIVTTLSGKTVEVISTDAEGRLILADALSYAQQHYKPSALIDVATLTGGIVTALGTVRAGLMCNDDSLAQALLDAGQRTHERLWRMPLDDDYFKQIKGVDSDIKNSGGLTATPVIGGVFLKQFIGQGVPWAHIDIAGVATTGRDQPGQPRKATGFGVRLLIDYLRHLEP